MTLRLPNSLIRNFDVIAQRNSDVLITQNFGSSFNSSNPLVLTNTGSSTSTSTGALVVSGGVGIGENLNVEGNIQVGNAITELKEPPNASSGTFTGDKGQYEISASSFYSVDPDFLNPYKAFDGNSGTYWQTDSIYQNDGLYNGQNGQNGYLGEWIQIQLPYSLRLDKFSISPLNIIGTQSQPPIVYAVYRSPRDFRVFGSNDGINWTQIFDVTGLEWSLSEKVFILENNSEEYSYYKFVVNKIGNESLAPNVEMICLNIGQIYLKQFTNVVIDKTLTNLNNVQLKGIMNAEGNVNLTNNLNVEGNVNIMNSLNVTNNLNVGSINLFRNVSSQPYSNIINVTGLDLNSDEIYRLEINLIITGDMFGYGGIPNQMGIYLTYNEYGNGAYYFTNITNSTTSNSEGNNLRARLVSQVNGSNVSTYNLFMSCIVRKNSYNNQIYIYGNGHSVNVSENSISTDIISTSICSSTTDNLTYLSFYVEDDSNATQVYLDSHSYVKVYKM